MPGTAKAIVVMVFDRTLPDTPPTDATIGKSMDRTPGANVYPFKVVCHAGFVGSALTAKPTAPSCVLIVMSTGTNAETVAENRDKVRVPEAVAAGSRNREKSAIQL